MEKLQLFCEELKNLLVACPVLSWKWWRSTTRPWESTLSWIHKWRFLARYAFKKSYEILCAYLCICSVSEIYICLKCFMFPGISPFYYFIAISNILTFSFKLVTVAQLFASLVECLQQVSISVNHFFPCFLARV